METAQLIGFDQQMHLLSGTTVRKLRSPGSVEELGEEAAVAFAVLHMDLAVGQ